MLSIEPPSFLASTQEWRHFLAGLLARKARESGEPDPFLASSIRHAQEMLEWHKKREFDKHPDLPLFEQRRRVRRRKPRAG